MLKHLLSIKFGIAKHLINLVSPMWLIIPVPSLSHELGIIITDPVYGFTASIFITTQVSRRCKDTLGGNCEPHCQLCHQRKALRPQLPAEQYQTRGGLSMKLDLPEHERKSHNERKSSRESCCRADLCSLSCREKRRQKP